MAQGLWHHHSGEESTGSYWVGLYFFLEETCFDVLLANAKDVKNVSGKKTDEADAEWIMLMPSYGLLKPSFHPDAAARSIRELARHRDNMLRSASKEVQHMQKHPHPDSRLRGGDGQTFRRIHGWMRHGYARLYGDKKAGGPKNAISFDAEKHAFSMWGVNAMEIPGMSLGGADNPDGGTWKRIHRKVHVGQELLQVEQPRSEQQNLRWQTSLEQGAQAEEQSRTGVQAMCQLSEKCQDGTRHIFQEAEVQRWPSTSYCSDRE